MLVSNSDIENADNFNTGYLVVERDCIYIHLTSSGGDVNPDMAVVWTRGTQFDEESDGILLPNGDLVVANVEMKFSGQIAATDVEASTFSGVDVSDRAMECASRFDRMVLFGEVLPI